MDIGGYNGHGRHLGGGETIALGTLNFMYIPNLLFVLHWGYEGTYISEG